MLPFYIVQMRKPMLREFKQLVQGHVACKRWSQELDPSLSDFHKYILTTMLHYAAQYSLLHKHTYFQPIPAFRIHTQTVLNV